MVYNRITHLHLSFSQPQQALASANLNKNYDSMIHNMLYSNNI